MSLRRWSRFEQRRNTPKDQLLSCQVDINECSSNPCFWGNCVNSLVFSRTDYYECACLPGFTGEKCETEINECDSNPCGSNGSCTNLINGFSCICDSGYFGDNCQSEINPCSSSPCDNFGVCLKTAAGVYACDCPPGADSSDIAVPRTLKCDLDVDECSSNPCQNGGTCENVATEIDLYLCACPVGYTGFSCEINVNDCGTKDDDNPCGDFMNNRGTCTDGVGVFTCACNTGVGATCGLDVEECASKQG